MAFGSRLSSGGKRALWLVVIALFAIIFATWVIRRYQESNLPPTAARIQAEMPSENVERVTAGHVLYDAHCAGCHGANLEGQPDWRHRLPNGRLPAPPQDASGHTWHHPNKMLFDVVKFGPARLAPPGYESDMPGFAGTLSDDQIWMVLEFIESTWPPEIRRKHAEMGGEKPDEAGASTEQPSSAYRPMVGGHMDDGHMDDGHMDSMPMNPTPRGVDKAR